MLQHRSHGLKLFNLPSCADIAQSAWPCAEAQVDKFNWCLQPFDVCGSGPIETHWLSAMAANPAASDDPRFTTDVVERVAALIASAELTGERLPAWDAIKKILIEAKLGWSQQLWAPFCGVHNGNRSGEGVGGSEAHNHARDIVRAGFSWSKAADAVAVELPHAEMARLSGGLTPPINVLKVSHTNTFLRAVIAGCESICPELSDSSGRLNKERLCLGRKSFKEAVDCGLR